MTRRLDYIFIIRLQFIIFVRSVFVRPEFLLAATRRNVFCYNCRVAYTYLSAHAFFFLSLHPFGAYKSDDRRGDCDDVTVPLRCIRCTHARDTSCARHPLDPPPLRPRLYTPCQFDEANFFIALTYIL